MEIVAASYRQSFFHNKDSDHPRVLIATARAGNVIGGGDWAENRLVPDAIRALSNGENLRVRNPQSLRPWQHVLEPLSGYLWLAAKLAQPGGERYASAWNFGPFPESQQSVAQLVEAVVKTWGAGKWCVDTDTQLGHETSTLNLSIDKAITHLGWKPVWNFKTAVERTVIWYKKAVNMDPEQHYQLLADEIERYQSAAERMQLKWTV